MTNGCGCGNKNGIQAYFKLEYKPSKLSQLENDTNFQDNSDVAESISEHNLSEEAHPYIQSVIASTTETLETSIGDEATAREQADNTLQNNIDGEITAREQAVSLAISTTEAYADNSVSVHNSSTSAHTYIQGIISDEVTNRENADNNLQTQIDGLAAASDVTDIVGTYAELQTYDTQHLNDNDIIKVLSDSTHQDQPSYYRFDKETNTFSYIGSEDAGYTKAQVDAKFVTQTTTINGEALSQNITLTATEVGALPSTTTIKDLTTTAQQNALNSGVTSAVVSQVGTNTTNIASNTSAISTINGKISTDASTTNKLITASTLAAATSLLANQDLSNLSDAGNDKLRSLNSYANDGELLTDPDGLAFVEKYAHSTFDASKFTVVGSPNITDDGIVSGFSRNDYLQIPMPNLSQGTWTISAKFNVNSYASSGYTPVFASSASNQVLTLTIDSSGKLAGAIGNSTGTNWQITESSGWQGTKITINTNTDYWVKMTFDGSYYKILYSTDGIHYSETITATSSTSISYNASYNFNLGRPRATANNDWLNGSIDLKQLSITVDGVPVFSGNKTGIDTIKPDDYTVVGTPTISADGIASGFSSGNYLQTPAFDFTKPFKIVSPFVITGNSFNNAILQITGSNGWFNYIRLSSYFIEFIYQLSDSTNGYLTINMPSIWSSNVKFFVELEFTGTKYIITLKDQSNNIIDSNEVDSSLSLYNASSSNVNIGVDKHSNYYLRGSIDLNAFKIYVDGNLVYQPCLKIPYTESKTGSKIVGVNYRERVKDMYKLFGYAPYYTLSDTDFTLPQGELYGLIGQRTLRDNYRNGINYWELYSNRDLEQGGSCTSGVEITFARPFADTNYVLSVPYSAKSATAFTPTQTGDWIAKGKGLL